MTVYQENGYKNRADYLKSMAEDYGVDLDTVLYLADVLGEREDFDGLVVVNNDEEAVNSICIAIDKFEASRETIVENKFNVKTWEDIAKMFIGLGN